MDDFETEVVTREIPVQTLDQVASEWKASLASRCPTREYDLVTLAGLALEAVT